MKRIFWILILSLLSTPVLGAKTLPGQDEGLGNKGAMEYCDEYCMREKAQGDRNINLQTEKEVPGTVACALDAKACTPAQRRALERGSNQ